LLTCGGGDGTSCGGEGQGTGRKQATIIGKGRRRTSDEDVASGRGLVAIIGEGLRVGLLTGAIGLGLNTCSQKFWHTIEVVAPSPLNLIRVFENLVNFQIC